MRFKRAPCRECMSADQVSLQRSFSMLSTSVRREISEWSCQISIGARQEWTPRKPRTSVCNILANTLSAIHCYGCIVFSNEHMKMWSGIYAYVLQEASLTYFYWMCSWPTAWTLAEQSRTSTKSSSGSRPMARRRHALLTIYYRTCRPSSGLIAVTLLPVCILGSCGIPQQQVPFDICCR